MAFMTVLERLISLHGQKIRSVSLVDIKVNSIFEVEQFVKQFMSKLITR